MANIYVGDIGTVVLVDLGLITLNETTDTISFNVIKPGDDATSALSWDASIYSISKPSLAFFVADENSFDRVGHYKLQAEVERDDGGVLGRWLGTATSFDVKDVWT